MEKQDELELCSVLIDHIIDEKTKLFYGNIRRELGSFAKAIGVPLEKLVEFAIPRLRKSVEKALANASRPSAETKAG